MSKILLVVGNVSEDQYQSTRKELLKNHKRLISKRCTLTTWRYNVADLITEKAKTSYFYDKVNFRNHVDSILRQAVNISFNDLSGVLINLIPSNDEEEEELEWSDEEVIKLCSYLFDKEIVCRSVFDINY